MAQIASPAGPYRTAAIALGSNIEPETNLPAALDLLREQVRLTAVSRVYRTPPWGYQDQPDFLNAVAIGETTLAPEPLLEMLLGFEIQLKRTRTRPNGPRTMDLDLLFLDDLVRKTDRLTLPHPRLHERGFVLVPLNDVAPEWRHPVLKKTVAEFLDGVNTTSLNTTGISVADLQLPL